ncbi:MAG: polynucleotide adenylyltransferase PcnB [Steroidobacteraceae bacterium]
MNNQQENHQQPVLSVEDAAAPVVVPRAEHPISRSSISPSALKVLYRLKDAGYQAFLVGGAVRDLLLGRNPKDFDIGTNAHPEQVRELFRNCRLIGRRFHLAHVRFGQEVIEVATFRAAHTLIDDDNSVDEDSRRVLDTHGRILRDNLYGSIDEDVWRRDFTANALYYNIHDYSIWDYTGGVADARARLLKLIGDPETRYREDPVRMLRAVRFAAKLDFTIDVATARPIPKLAYMLDGVPAARLFDEVNKLFLSGSALRSFELLRDHALLAHLFPELTAALSQSTDGVAERLIRLGLAGTDERIAADKSVTPAFLFAVLLWPAVRRQAMQFAAMADSPIQALQDAWDTIAARAQRRVALPKRFSLSAREMVALQPRFDHRGGKRSLRLLEHPRFRAAYDFLLLRAAAGEVEQSVADWWTEIQTLPAEARAARVEATATGTREANTDGVVTPAKKRRRRRSRSKRPAPDA